MIRKSFAVLAAASLGALLVGTSAHASTDVFNLNGSVAGFSYSPSTDGEQGSISLSGLSPTVVSQGDALSISLALDGPLTVPAGTNFSYIGIDFSGTGFDGSPVVLSDNFTITNGGVTTATYTGGTTGTSDQLATEAVFFNQAVTFDGLTDGAQVLTLSSPVTVTGATLVVGSFNNAVAAAPEPSTWALMLIGVGGLGAVLRASRRHLATSSAIA